jgi:hypothetical protein
MTRANIHVPWRGTPAELNQIHLRIELEVTHALDAYGREYIPSSNVKLNVKLACMLWGVLYENRKHDIDCYRHDIDMPKDVIDKPKHDIDFSRLS